MSITSLSPIQSKALGEAISLYQTAVRSNASAIVGREARAQLRSLGGHPEFLQQRPGLFGAAYYVLKFAFANSDAFLQRWHFHSEARARGVSGLMAGMREGLHTEWHPILGGKPVRSDHYLDRIGAVDGKTARRAAGRFEAARPETKRPRYPLSRPSDPREDFLAPGLPRATLRVDGQLLAWACVQVFQPTKARPVIDPSLAQTLGFALALTDSRNDAVTRGRYSATLLAAWEGGPELPLAIPHQTLGATVPKWMAAALLAQAAKGHRT